MIVHFNEYAADDTGVQLAAEIATETGWVGFGFSPEGSGRMVGSTAVIATESAANGAVGVFAINAYSASGLIEATGSVEGPSDARRKVLQPSSNVALTSTDVCLCCACISSL